jgi:hypothetical protein
LLPATAPNADPKGESPCASPDVPCFVAVLLAVLPAAANSFAWITL